MRKYTDDELSRILGASAAGQLRRFGGDAGSNRFCIEQAALLAASIPTSAESWKRAGLFDGATRRSLPKRDPDRVLAWLEKSGLA